MAIIFKNNLLDRFGITGSLWSIWNKIDDLPWAVPIVPIKKGHYGHVLPILSSCSNFPIL